MPDEETTEESQEEFGWENLTAHDDGRRDMEEIAPEPTQQGDQEAPAETPTEAAPEPTPKVVEPTGEAAETPKGTEEPPPEETVYTLPGGKKITQSELIADPELLAKLVTHSNQVAQYQTLAEERQAQLNESEAEKRKLLDQYTEWDMQRRVAAEQPAPAEPPQRPDAKVLAGIYAPHLDQLVTDGRVTADQRSEFGNILSEYMFDNQNLVNLITTVVEQGSQRFAGLENELKGEVVPDVQRRQQQDAVFLDQSIQQGVAAKPGYESLKNPEEWERLKLFIAEHMNASPKDDKGRPTFDPNFTVDGMAQMYDAMTGADMRATLAAIKANQEKQDTTAAAMAGGETAARAGTPPPRQPPKMTPEEEAMDFHDPSMATG